MNKFKIQIPIIHYYSTYLHFMESLLSNKNKIEFYGLEFQITETYIGYIYDLIKEYNFIIYYPYTNRIQHIIQYNNKYNNIENYHSNIIGFVFSKFNYLYKMKFSKILNENYEKVYIIKKINLTWLIYLGNELPFLCTFNETSPNDIHGSILDSLIEKFHKQSIIVGIIHINQHKLIKPFFSKCTYKVPKNTDNFYKIIFIGTFTNDYNITFYTILY